MSGKNSIDLGELQREAERQRAALRASEAKIAKIEEEARLVREESDRKARELATLQKKLAACRENILWFEGKIDQFRAIAAGQVAVACDGAMEGALNLAGSLAEIAGWELAVAAFREYERSLPERIAELGG